MRLGILGSTRGSHLLPIIEAIQNKTLSATISVVLSNKQEALILEKAKQFNIPAFFIDPKQKTREQYDAELSHYLKNHSIDYIVLIGYMRILSAEFVREWQNKIINIHPSLLPKHKGLMDLAVHQAVLDANDQETGCTVHYVTEMVDEGPIILQMQCEVNANDTAESLKQRVQALEAKALIKAINQVISLHDNS